MTLAMSLDQMAFGVTAMCTGEIMMILGIKRGHFRENPTLENSTVPLPMTKVPFPTEITHNNPRLSTQVTQFQMTSRIPAPDNYAY